MRRNLALPATMAFLALPLVLAAAEAVSFRVHNRSNGHVLSAGERRAFLLYVPRGYDGSRAVPLMLSLHGAGLWGAGHRDMSGWNAVADREGFIVAYPSAAAGEGPRIWHVERGSAVHRDVRFISDLIDTLARTYRIDTSRVYVNGFSNGGGMSFVLSCMLARRIAAVGLVGAALTLPADWCRDSTPVPVIAFHGTDDNAAPYRGGGSWVSFGRPVFADVGGFVAAWARRNRCGAPTDSSVAADVVLRSYGGCAANASVLLYTVLDGGHTWPGRDVLPGWWVGPTSTGVNANEAMWRFFVEHPRPPGGLP